MNAHYCKLKKGYCGCADLDDHYQVICVARSCPLRGEDKCLTQKGQSAERSAGNSTT